MMFLIHKSMSRIMRGSMKLYFHMLLIHFMLGLAKVRRCMQTQDYLISKNEKQQFQVATPISVVDFMNSTFMLYNS